jgi:hypothetical protein
MTLSSASSCCTFWMKESIRSFGNRRRRRRFSLQVPSSAAAYCAADWLPPAKLT